MNATPDHDVMRRLDDAGYRDAGEVSNEGWQPTWPANHVGILPLLPPLVRIDHVMIGDSMASLGTHTVDIEGTDHLALVATVAGDGRRTAVDRRTRSSTAGTAPWAAARPGRAGSADGRLRPAVVDRRRLVDRGVHRALPASTRTSTCRSWRATYRRSARTSVMRGRPWSNDGGTLRPLSDRFPEPFDAESQIWLRRDASSPWEVDLPITPDRDGLWTSKRWSSHVAPRRRRHLGCGRRDPLPAPGDHAALQGPVPAAEGRARPRGRVAAAARGPAGLAARGHRGHRGAGPPVAARLRQG